MIGKKQQLEIRWQQLFLDNPFILRLTFGLPIGARGGQVSVGGRKFDGTGNKVTDFLYRNGLTDITMATKQRLYGQRKKT